MLRTNSSKTLLVVALLMAAGVTSAPAFQLAQRSASDWIKTLDRPARVKNLKVPQVVQRLHLKPGMVIADIGAGSGIFTIPFAKAVGPKGKVYAVDIEQGLLNYINKRAKKEKLSNVKTVLGAYDDPKLPGRVDVAFFNDVLHHIEHRALYLKNLAKYVKPNGRVVIIEMNKNNPHGPHAGHPEMLISRAEMDRWMAAAGFQPVDEDKQLFPGTQYFVFYSRKKSALLRTQERVVLSELRP